MVVERFGKSNTHITRRVLFVNNGSLLDEGVMALIGVIEKLEVVKVSYSREELLAQDIAITKPDVVLICQTNLVRLDRLFQILAFNNILEKLKIIVIHPDNNWLDVYWAKHFSAIRSENFLGILQGDAWMLNQVPQLSKIAVW